MKRTRSIAVAALVFILGTGCSDSTTEPIPRTSTLLASKTLQRYRLHPGLQSTHGEYELIVAVFDAPRATADPQYYLFEGYSYGPGDAGRTISIKSDEDDPDFTTVATLLSDGIRNVVRYRTNRVDGSMDTLDDTDYSLALAAGYTTEDLTGMRITEFRIYINKMQITQEGGDTIEEVIWTLEVYGQR